MFASTLPGASCFLVRTKYLHVMYFGDMCPIIRGTVQVAVVNLSQAVGNEPLNAVSIADNMSRVLVLMILYCR